MDMGDVPGSEAARTSALQTLLSQMRTPEGPCCVAALRVSSGCFWSPCRVCVYRRAQNGERGCVIFVPVTKCLAEAASGRRGLFWLTVGELSLLCGRRGGGSVKQLPPVCLRSLLRERQIDRQHCGASNS